MGARVACHLPGPVSHVRWSPVARPGAITGQEHAGTLHPPWLYQRPEEGWRCELPTTNHPSTTHPPPTTMTSAVGEQTWKSLVYNTDITPDEVKGFYKTWAASYEDDMNNLQFNSAGLLADMLTDALKRSGRTDAGKVGTIPPLARV